MMVRKVINGIQLSAEQWKQLSSRYEREHVGVKDWMFRFLMLWTVVLLYMQWSEFFVRRAVPTSIGAGYIVLLGTYIAHKEVLRWTGISTRVRRGEFFVYVWWGMLLSMFIVEYASGRWSVPGHMLTLSYEVLGYFLLTEVSKAINTWRASRNGAAAGKQ